MWSAGRGLLQTLCSRQSWAIFSSFQRLSSERRTLDRLLNRLDHDVMLKVTGILTSSSSAEFIREADLIRHLAMCWRDRCLFKTVVHLSLFTSLPQCPFDFDSIDILIETEYIGSFNDNPRVSQRAFCASRFFGNLADSVLPGSPRLNRSARFRKLTHLLNKAGLGQSAASDNGQRD
jgi:hypothetical protein